MLERAKRSWAELKKGRPGERFQKRYERKNEAGRTGWRKPLMLGVGLVVVLAGLFFLPAPGPGMVILAIGAGILAEESLAMARALDWVEMRIRDMIGWARSVWERTGTVAHAAFVTAGLAVAGAGAYGAWWLVFER